MVTHHCYASAKSFLLYTRSEDGVIGSKLRGAVRLGQTRQCAVNGVDHSLAAMKLMWGLARGKRGRLLLNSVMSWTTTGCKHKSTECLCRIRKWATPAYISADERCVTWGREGAGARLTSFWAGNSPTTGPGITNETNIEQPECYPSTWATQTNLGEYLQESISRDSTCTDTLCLFRASTDNRSCRERENQKQWERVAWTGTPPLSSLHLATYP